MKYPSDLLDFSPEGIRKEADRRLKELFSGDEIPVYGIWIRDHEGGGWLTSTSGMIFQSPSRACAEAQLEIIAWDNAEVRLFGDR